MKAFLLAGGEGTRLRPFTFHAPKCLIPIGGIPLLEIWYRQLERIGIREVLINTHHLPENVTSFIQSLKTSIQTHITFEPELLGSAGTILQNRAFVEKEPYFWIIYVDSLTTMDFMDLLVFHQKNHSILTLGLFHTDVPQDSGIVTLDAQGRVIDFVEKPQEPRTDLSNTGIMIASPQLIEEIPEKIPCDLSYDVLPKLIGRMYGKVTEAFFIDIGTVERYQEALRKWDFIKKELGF